MWVNNLFYTLIFILIIYSLKHLYNKLKENIFLPSSFLYYEDDRNKKNFFEEYLNENEIGLYSTVFNKYTILTKPKIIFKEINYYMYHLNKQFYGVITENLDFYIIELKETNVNLEELEKLYNITLFETNNFKYLIIKNNKDKLIEEYLYYTKTKKFYKIILKTKLPHKGIIYYIKHNGKIIKNRIIDILEKEF